MAVGLCRSSTTFRYAFSNPEQFTGWLEEQRNSLTGVAFVGRSNVGKSSTINSLFGQKTAHTSKTPGRTREINVFSFNLERDGKVAPELGEFFLFDLPGYGHASVSKQMAKNWEALMDVFFTNATGKVLMINIQDARHPHQNSDQAFHQYLANYFFDTILCFNKLDKLKKQQERSALDKIRPKLMDLYKWVREIHFISAEAKKNLAPLEMSLTTWLLNEKNTEVE